ncbi:MAG: YjbH domain-containing protein [candidate division Zixibacteria bacterium]|nr:YjbH domain-containing protein [candidate division Zixibacteria bacterium]
MTRTLRNILIVGLAGFLGRFATAQEELVATSGSLFDVPPRQLVDMPTAGTLPRAHFDIGLRLYPNGGSIGYTNIGLSNRLMLGISYGGDNIISNRDPNWNKRIEFNIKFRVIDEMEYFPAVTAGFSSQGYGAWNEDFDRYTFKSRGFYVVASRSFYFYQWTAGWHGGASYSLENDIDKDKDMDFFVGFDATFRYNLALLMEYDVALNDDKSRLPDGTDYIFAGKGRGYFNMSVKWLFTENLELEALIKNLSGNRRGEKITREIRITYIDMF